MTHTYNAPTQWRTDAEPPTVPLQVLSCVHLESYVSKSTSRFTSNRSSIARLWHPLAAIATSFLQFDHLHVAIGSNPHTISSDIPGTPIYCRGASRFVSTVAVARPSFVAFNWSCGYTTSFRHT